MLIVKETKNVDDIKEVLCHKDIFKDISEDGSPTPEDYKPTMKNQIYIGGYIDTKIVGVIHLHEYKDGIEGHIQVLPGFRKKYAQEFFDNALRFVSSKNLYARIPTKYVNVINFVKFVGFVLIDKESMTYVKDGNSYDVNIFKYKGF